MSNKIAKIIEGAVIIALGVLIAIFGGNEVVDIYFGVMSLIAGVILLTLSVVSLVRKEPLLFSNLFLGTSLVVVAIFLLARFYISFGLFINLLVLLLLGLGIALILYGVYVLAKVSLFYGIGQIVVGAAFIVFSCLYIWVPEFATAFWIIVGVLVALYGLIFLLSAIFDKKNK